MTHPLSREDYTVGWVCALPIELAAAQEMLDKKHPFLPQVSGDTNIYSLGNIRDHNVVIACLPAGQTGTNSAAVAATQMMSTFRAIRFGLMVGIGGGVPSPDSPETGIRLGDVVVSQPCRDHGGVIQYDFGKKTPSGFERTGCLSPPPRILLAAVSQLRAMHYRGESNLLKHISKLGNLPNFHRDKAGDDVLFDGGYNHVGGDNCTLCDDKRKLKPVARTVDTPEIHYGTIASGNQVMRNGAERDQISSKLGRVLCFEMEAAGLMNSFPCLVIRGICDYADSHKNKKWQPYAAGTAAAYAKELLLMMPAEDVKKTQTVDQATRATICLPFERNRRFVGRNSEIDTLKQKLLEKQDCQKVAISGLGGIGKTQVALQFAYFVKQEYPEFSIFWVQAMSMETFERGCMEMATALKISHESQDDVKKLLRQRLCEKKTGKWLLIVDNADDLDLIRGSERTEGLLTFLPESEDGLTIFTTRHGEVAQYLASSDVVEIGKMTTQETISLFKESLVQKSSPDTDETVMDLLTELECLPLAITQAAAYINSNKSSISEYLGLLKNTDKDAVIILSKNLGDKTRYRHSANAIAKTWMITFNKISEQDKLAANLLAFISCIEWRAIPYSILPADHPKALLAGAVGTLCSYSFLEKRDGGKKLDMHRLVHLAMRTWISENDLAAETSMAALKHLSKVFPYDDWLNRETWRDYLPHVARIDKNKQCQGTEEKSELCLRVGRCLLVDGRMNEAVLWLQESCEWRERYLVEDNANRLASQHALAGAYQANGQVKEAVKLLEHVVAIKAKVFAEEEGHPSRLASQHALAGAYQANGQVKEAVKLLEHVVAIRVEVLAEGHPNRLASQHELARAYQANGQVKEAVKLLEHVVAIKAKVFAEEEGHPSRLASQHALAGAYQANGQVKEAVKLLEHVVAIEVKVLAEDHPSRLASQHALAKAYQANGQVKEAVKLLEHVVAIRVEVLAEDHPSRLASQHELAGVYQANGQVKEAVKLLEHVVAIQAKVLAEDHPSRLASQHELARAYQANSQVKEAVKLLEHVVAIRVEVLAEGHPDRLASQHALARAYQANSQVKEAVKLLEHVVAIRVEVLAEGHPDRLASQHALARAYQANGQVKEAVKLLEHVVAIRAKVLAEDHPNRLASQHALAGAYEANGQVKEAVKLLEHVVAIKAKVLAEDHPSRLISERVLALFSNDLSERSETGQTLESAIDDPGAKHEDILAVFFRWFSGRCGSRRQR